MAHQRLKTAIFDRGIKMSAVAKHIGVSTRALYNKIEGVSSFTWDEVCSIQKQFFPDMLKDDLFVENDKTA